jgi:hypothetical protein
LKEAIEIYVERYKVYPDHFLIYRDGVGDAMRKQVIDEEVS